MVQQKLSMKNLDEFAQFGIADQFTTKVLSANVLFYLILFCVNA